MPKAPSITYVIPTFNAGAMLDDLLQDLDGQPVLIIDGGSTDGTEDRANLRSTKTGRGFQIAEGCKAANSDWFFIAHADSRLSTDAFAKIETHAKTNPNAAYFDLNFRSKDRAARIVEQFANLRSRLFGLPYGDQGLLISQALLDKVGGYPKRLLMEDVFLARRVGKSRLTCLGSGLSTSAAKYHEHGWLRRGSIHLICLAMHLIGCNENRILKFYRL